MRDASEDGSMENEGTVVVYSSYRTASTWLWTRMRKHHELYCYYEVFNEALASLTREQAISGGSADWRSRHPEVASYREEYLPLIDGQGVAGFPEAEDTDGRFVSRAGLNGSLDDDVHLYLQTLVDHARRQGRRPVLSGQRMLGRSHGIRRAFPGFHILLMRNLFHQWNSYSGQLRTGNPYFLWTLNRTLSLSSRDPFVAHMAESFAEGTIASLEAWTSAENSDNLFCYFVGFHIYFYLETRSNVDLVIDSTRLAEPDGNYRQHIERVLSDELGLAIDFTDVRAALDLPSFPIWQPALCRSRIAAYVETAHSMRGSTTEERDFAEGMLADLWREWELFAFYSLGAREHIADLDTRLATQTARLNVLEELCASSSDIEARLAQTQEAVVREEKANQVLRDQVERQRAVSVQRDRDLARLYERLADQRVQAGTAGQRAIHLEAGNRKMDEQSKQDQATINGLLHEREMYVVEHSRLEDELAKLRTETQRIQEAGERRAVEMAEQERLGAEERIRQVQEDFGAERTQLSNEITQATQRKVVLENALRDCTEKLSVSNLDRATETRERDQLQARVGDLDGRLAEITAKYQQVVLERDDLRARWDQLTQHLTSDEGPRALRWVLPLARALRLFAQGSNTP